MAFVKTKRYLLAPPYCKTVETFISPIPCSPSEVSNGLKLAGGWRCFKNLKVLQKKKENLIEVKMTTKELLKVAKNYSKTCFHEAELQIDNLVNKRLPFGKLDISKAHIMGVINITPDSFYKKSQTNNTNKLSKNFYEMINSGASIIDIGGESSRPGAEKISVVEEKNRVVDLIKQLKNYKIDSLISLDSRNLSTMKSCYKIGVDIFNDITAFKEKNKIDFISKTASPIIMMHMQKEPINMQINPKYSFAPIDIYKFFSKKITDLIEAGVKKSNIVIDPGIGFGKTLSDNLNILKYLPLFHGLGVPILVGVSRKSLIEELTVEDFNVRGKNKKSVNPSKRLSGSLAFAMHANRSGVQIIRTHDVFETNQALICQKALNL
jgi:dihydropteroate synthase